MNTEVKRTASELKAVVSRWVDKTFNFISLQNAEKVFDKMLFEHIESNCTENTANDFILDYGYGDEYQNSHFENHLDFVMDRYEDEFREYADQDHYPMWNTLFEFKENVSDEIINEAVNAGFGIIGKSDYYNTMLFVKGAGYSFYGAHWIPFYLNLPWVDDKEWKGIDYTGM